MSQSWKKEMRSPMRWWQTGLVGVLVVAGLLTIPQPAAALPCWLNPLCLVDEGFDIVWDQATSTLDLAWNIVTLDPEGVYTDLKDIAQNLVCGIGAVTVLNLIGADVAEGLYNNSCAAEHSIEPEVLAKLQLYFKPSIKLFSGGQSPFKSVVIHEACDFSNRNAITFGDHIYFQKYDPKSLSE